MDNNMIANFGELGNFGKFCVYSVNLTILANVFEIFTKNFRSQN
jgi:hypothetical protein